MAEFKITPKELAAELGVSDKRVRSVMRSLTERDSQPGSGGRWAIDSTEFADAIRAKVKATHNRREVIFTPKATD